MLLNILLNIAAAAEGIVCHIQRRDTVHKQKHGGPQQGPQQKEQGEGGLLFQSKGLVVVGLSLGGGLGHLPAAEEGIGLGGLPGLLRLVPGLGEGALRLLEVGGEGV